MISRPRISPSTSTSSTTMMANTMGDSPADELLPVEPSVMATH